MRAKELREQMADRTGISIEKVVVVDRALADNNLRTKGRGRMPPEVSLQDAIRLLVGLTAAPAATRAHEAVRDVSKFALFDTSGDAELVFDVTGQTIDRLREPAFVENLAAILELQAEAEPSHKTTARTTIAMEIEIDGMVRLFIRRGTDALELEFSGAVDTEPAGWGGIVTVNRVPGPILRWMGENFDRRRGSDA